MDTNKELLIPFNDNYSEIILKKTKYDYSKKMELVKKINKIKKKEYLLNIFKIIYNSSSDYTENNNGIFIFFHNLTDDIYEKIENYVNIIYRQHFNNGIKNYITSELSDNYLIISDENIQSDVIELKNINKELSNKEKMIMRRKKYEQYLNQNQD